MHKLLTIGFSLIISLLVLSCKKKAPAVDPSFSTCEHAVDNRHNRTIGYDILDATESGDFGANYAIAAMIIMVPTNVYHNNWMKSTIENIDAIVALIDQELAG